MGDPHSPTKDVQEYDAVYFDSDDEQDTHGGTAAGSSAKGPGNAANSVDSAQVDMRTDSDSGNRGRKKPRKARTMESNDELFYDPDIDDDNQRWADEQRTKNYAHSTTLNTNAASAEGSVQNTVPPPPGAPRM